MIRRIITIFVIFVFFGTFSSVKNVFSTSETKPPYVLVEYDDRKIANNDDKNPWERIDHHYEVPTCAAEDESKHEVVYSASGEWFRILYVCFPVSMNDCAIESGNFRNNYCVFDGKPKCGVEGSYEYVIKPVLDSRGGKMSCVGWENNGELYRVGYDLRFAKGDSANVDIYRFCFNKTTEKTLYVEYKIISPNLLGTNVDDESYRKQIETSSFDRHDLGDFSKKKKYFAKVRREQKMRFSRHLDKPDDRRLEVDVTTKYKSSLLIPTEHMALDWWKAPLFHIVNQQLLREKFLPDIISINKYIRNKAKEILGELFIRAGTFDLADYEFHSYTWWKLIYNEKRTHAIGIIIHNETIAPEAKVCGSTHFCEEIGWNDLVPPDSIDFIYCCTPDYLINAFNFAPVDTLDLIKLPKEVFEGVQKDCKVPIPDKSGSQNGSLGKGQNYGGFLSTILAKWN